MEQIPVAVSPKRLRFRVSWALGEFIRFERRKINNIGICKHNFSLIFFAFGMEEWGLEM